MDSTEQWGTVGCVVFLLWALGCMMYAPRDLTMGLIVAPIALLVLTVAIVLTLAPRQPRS